MVLDSASVQERDAVQPEELGTVLGPMKVESSYL